MMDIFKRKSNLGSISDSLQFGKAPLLFGKQFGEHRAHHAISCAGKKRLITIDPRFSLCDRRRQQILDIISAAAGAPSISKPYISAAAQRHDQLSQEPKFGQILLREFIEKCLGGTLPLAAKQAAMNIGGDGCKGVGVAKKKRIGHAAVARDTAGKRRTEGWGTSGASFGRILHRLLLYQ